MQKNTRLSSKKRRSRAFFFRLKILTQLECKKYFLFHPFFPEDNPKLFRFTSLHRYRELYHLIPPISRWEI